MRRQFFGLTLLGLLALNGTSVWAQDYSPETGRSQTTYSGMNYRSTAQAGFAGYLGANAGYTGYNKSLDVEGAPTSLKLIGSYAAISVPAVLDLGYGVQSVSFSQKAATDSAISTGVMEVAARYQFENRWQLGAVYNQFFNKGESFAANQADVEFGGVQVLREFNLGNQYLGRAGGRIMTSLNINNQNVTMGLIDFQMGWGGQTTPTRSASRN